MSRLLRFILFLIFSSTVILFIAHLLGETNPASHLSVVMSGADAIPCDRPCLFGVRPGETSLEQASQILHSHPLTHDAKWLTDHTIKLNGLSAYIDFNLTPDNLVDSITFTDSLDPSHISVADSLVDSIVIGELVLAFGTPNILLPESPFFVMGFPTVGVMAISARPPQYKAFIKPDTPIRAIMLYKIRPCPTDKAVFMVQPWIGFTTMRRYVNDQRKYEFSHRNSGVVVPPFAQCQI